MEPKVGWETPTSFLQAASAAGWKCLCRHMWAQLQQVQPQVRMLTWPLNPALGEREKRKSKRQQGRWGGLRTGRREQQSRGRRNRNFHRKRWQGTTDKTQDERGRAGTGCTWGKGTLFNRVNSLPLEAGVKAGNKQKSQKTEQEARKKEWREGVRVVLDAVEKAV